MERKEGIGKEINEVEKKEMKRQRRAGSCKGRKRKEACKERKEGKGRKVKKKGK